jgi:uncharacterized protein (DUF2384 family)
MATLALDLWQAMESARDWVRRKLWWLPGLLPP